MNAVGRVYVVLQSISGTGVPGTPEVIGSIAGTTSADTGSAAGFRRFLGYFLSDRDRFPASGGHAVTPGSYKVWLEGAEALRSDPAWGPYNLAKGTLIDIDISL